MDPPSRTVATELSNQSSPESARTAAPVRKTSRRRLRWWVLGSLAIVFVVFVAATLRLFVYPPTDQLRHVDGIVSFDGPDEGARATRAVSLAEKGYAKVLLFSQGGKSTDTECPKVPRILVVCFVDVTNNTRGEAEWAGRYAERHHWHSLLLVPGRAQATRARLLTARCFSGQLVVVPASESRPSASQIIHEWGGVLQALFIQRSC